MKFIILTLDEITKYITIHAKNEQGIPFNIIIRNFKNSVYVACSAFKSLMNDEEYNNVARRSKCIKQYLETFPDIEILGEPINYNVKREMLNNMTIVMRKNGFCYHEMEPHICLTLPNSQYTKGIHKQLLEYGFQPLNSCLDGVRQFMSSKNMTGAGWFEIDSYDTIPSTKYQNGIFASIKQCTSLPDKLDDIPNFRWLTFDIESLGFEDGAFPKGTINPIIQFSIKMHVINNGKKEEKVALLALRPSGSVAGCECFTFFAHEEEQLNIFFSYLDGFTSDLETSLLCDCMKQFNEKIHLDHGGKLSRDLSPCYSSLIHKMLRYVNLFGGKSDIEEFSKCRDFIFHFDKKKDSWFFPQLYTTKRLHWISTWKKLLPIDFIWLKWYLAHYDYDPEQYNEIYTHDKIMDIISFNDPCFLTEFIAFVQSFIPTEDEKKWIPLFLPRIMQVIEKGLFADERDMMMKFREIFLAFDPDVITGYNINNFDFPYLEDACKRLGIAPFDFSLGRPVVGKKAINTYEEDLAYVKRELTSAGINFDDDSADLNHLIALCKCNNIFLKINTYNRELLYRPIMTMKESFGNNATGKMKDKKITIHGRIVVDCHKVIKQERKLDEYNLRFAASVFLKRTKLDVGHKEIPILFNGSVADRQRLWEYNKVDSDLPPDIIFAEKFDQQMIQLSRTSGVNLQDVFGSGKSKMGVALFARFFYTMDIVMPSLKGKKESYEGAKVYVSRAGIYRWKMKDGKRVKEYIVNGDFSGMYPSIMMEYNFCVSTFIHEEEVRVRFPSVHPDPKIYEHPEVYKSNSDFYFLKRKIKEDGTVEREGALPKIVNMVVKRRAEVKVIIANLGKKINEIEKKLKELSLLTSLQPHEELDKQLWLEELDQLKREMGLWKMRELALKIIANSMYGIVGSSDFKWPLIAVAASVTKEGKHLIENVVEKTLYDVFPTAEIIYGDTDSLFYRPPGETAVECKQNSIHFAGVVNKKIGSKYISFEPEHLFGRSIYARCQKTYAGLEIKDDDDIGTLYIRGYACQKRSYCDNCRALVKKLIGMILIDCLELDDIFRYIHEYILKVININNSNDMEFIKGLMLKAKYGKEKYDGENVAITLKKKNDLLKNEPYFVGDSIPYFNVIYGGDKRVNNVELSNVVLSSIGRKDDGMFYTSSSERRILLDVETYLQNQFLNPIIKVFPGYENNIEYIFATRGVAFIPKYNLNENVKVHDVFTAVKRNAEQACIGVKVEERTEKQKKYDDKIKKLKRTSTAISVASIFKPVSNGPKKVSNVSIMDVIKVEKDEYDYFEEA